MASNIVLKNCSCIQVKENAIRFSSWNLLTAHNHIMLMVLIIGFNCDILYKWFVCLTRSDSNAFEVILTWLRCCAPKYIKIYWNKLLKHSLLPHIYEISCMFNKLSCTNSIPVLYVTSFFKDKKYNFLYTCLSITK